MGFQFQSVAAVGPFLVADLGRELRAARDADRALPPAGRRPRAARGPPGGARWRPRGRPDGPGSHDAGQPGLTVAGSLPRGGGGAARERRGWRAPHDPGRQDRYGLVRRAGAGHGPWRHARRLAARDCAGPGGARAAGGHDDMASGDPVPTLSAALAFLLMLFSTASGRSRCRRAPRGRALVDDHRAGDGPHRDRRSRMGHAERGLHHVPELRPEASRGAGRRPRRRQPRRQLGLVPLHLHGAPWRRAPRPGS